MAEAEKAANCLQSKVEYCCWVGVSLQEKKEPRCNCCKTGPACELEASAANDKSAPGKGWTKGVAAVNVVLAAAKVVAICLETCKAFRLPRDGR